MKTNSRLLPDQAFLEQLLPLLQMKMAAIGHASPINPGFLLSLMFSRQTDWTN